MKSNSNLLQQNAQEQATNGNEKSMLSDTSKHLVERHLNAFINNDLEAVVSDYTNESVLITQEATYIGTEEIKGFFAALIKHFPKQNSRLALDNFVAIDGVVFIVWHAETPSLNVPIGSDTFIIKDGNICQQTFVGQLNFIS